MTYTKNRKKLGTTEYIAHVFYPTTNDPNDHESVATKFNLNAAKKWVAAQPDALAGVDHYDRFAAIEEVRWVEDNFRDPSYGAVHDARLVGFDEDATLRRWIQVRPGDGWEIEDQ